MLWFPFICMGAGMLIGLHKASSRVIGYIDRILNLSLALLMLILGAKVGSDTTLVSNLGKFGLQCLVIALFAISGSVLCTVLLEKSILPLRQLRLSLSRETAPAASTVSLPSCEDQQTSPLVWIMPGCLIAGLASGYWLLGAQAAQRLDQALTFTLLILYVGVGVSFGVNNWVFRYVKMLSWKVFLLSGAITAGSLVGGFLAGLLLNLPVVTSVGAAAGMSYYSLTGAILTQAYGITTGAYGFLVNALREFLTVLLLPLLIRLSLGSPIASGGAGNMDTMLVPITKFVGVELGIVTLITGTILTMAVPVLLSLLIALG